ncbi:MAG TPA: methyltransferase [Gemmatales bacterium]|nr:methyltransferase [Gemmatales bacterium]
MPAPLTSQPLDLTVPVDLAILREVFVRADYTHQRCTQAAVIQRGPGVPQLNHQLSEQNLDDSTPFATLFRLFRLEQPLPTARVAAVFAPLSLDSLAALGLLRQRDAEHFEASLYISESNGLWSLSDLPSTKSDPLHVLGLTATGEKVDVLTPRRPCRRTLDVGTGNGYLALLASRHSEQVVATDINSRALALAEFNARLNGIRNVDFRHGSWFEPVAGERFDLICCNPPFIISPGIKSIFRDAGFPADGLMQMLAAEFARHLSDGGLGVFIGNWLVEEDDVARRPQRWLADANVDALILHGAPKTPLEYACHWLEHAHGDSGTAAFRQELQEWLAYYQEQKVEAIVNGGLVLRRRPGPNTFTMLYVQEAERGSCGTQLEFLFRQSDFLRQFASLAALESARLRLADSLELEQTIDIDAGNLRLRRCTLRHRQGMTLAQGLDEQTLLFLQTFNGRKTLGEVITELAQRFGAPRDAVAQQGTEFVLTCIVRGFLVPAEQP